MLGRSAALGESLVNEPFQTPVAVLQEALGNVRVEDGTNGVILLEEGRYHFDEEGRLTSRHRLVYKLLTSGAVEGWSMIERRWLPWHEQRPEIHARVITPDGEIHPLDPSTIADSPVREANSGVLTDAREVRVPLPALTAGAIVEQEVIVRETAPASKAGTLVYFGVGSSVPVVRTVVTVSTPANRPIQSIARLLPELSTSQRESGGRIEWRFEHGPLHPRLEPPPLLPPEEPRHPYLLFSNCPSWQAAAADYAAVVERQLAGWDARPYLPVFGPGASRESRIEAILTHLHAAVRYTGLEFGDASIVPRTPAEVLRRKYGDCKDKSTLLIALLRAAGIPAQLALLSSSEGADVDPEIPGLGRFNHAIVYVPGQPDLWLDPADPDARVGVLSASTQGRLALVADKHTTELVAIPRSLSSANRVVETREFHLAETGAAAVVETTEAWGTIDREYRGLFGRMEEKQLRDSLKTYAEWIYGQASLGSVSRLSADELTRPFVLRIAMQGARRGFTSRSEAAVGVVLGQVANRLPEFFRTAAPKNEQQKARIQEFFLPDPYSLEWRYRIVPPPGYAVRRLPEPFEEKLGPALLSASFAAGADGVVTGTVRFDVAKQRMAAAEGLTLREAVLALQQRPPLVVSFDQVGESFLAVGKVKEALQAFRALRELHPAEAVHCDQVARALLAAGAGEAARAEAQRGVELEPGSFQAWANLAAVLKHDLVGRPLKKGYDREGAIRAYRRALELAPENTRIRANLAIVLEYDESGERYSGGAQLSHALGEYEEIRDKLGELGLTHNFAIALAHAGRWKELRSFLEKQPDQETNRTLSLMTAAMLDGPDAALGSAAREIPGVEERRKALYAAGQTLMNLRHYAAAAELVNAGAGAAPNPAAALNLAQILHHTRRAEDLTLRRDNPEDVIRLLFRSMLHPGENHRDLLRSFSSRLRHLASEASVAAMGSALLPTPAHWESTGLSREAALDLSLATMRLSVQGDDTQGYEVRVTMPGGSAGTQTLLFHLTRERNELRILSTPGDWEGVARMALELAAEDRLEQATLWLDRARAEFHNPEEDDDAPAAVVFPALWKCGQRADKETIQLAAAALLSMTDGAPDAIAMLDASARFSGEPRQRRLATIALATALLRANQAHQAVEVAMSLHREIPTSRRVFLLGLEALARAGRSDEAREFFSAHFQRFESDEATLEQTASLLMEIGAYQEAHGVLGKLLASGKAEDGHYNAAAWNDLLRRSVSAETDRAIQQAMLLSGGHSHAILHTLAAIQAEKGRANDARTTLLHRMELAGSKEPNGEDWYVFGRIAEQYGLEDAAEAMYARVEKPGDESSGGATSYRLVQFRLAELRARHGNR